MRVTRPTEGSGLSAEAPHSGANILSAEAPHLGAKTLATATFAGMGYFGVSLVALHFIRTDYDPVSENVSQYAIGPYGYMMTAAFFILGPAVIALAIGLFEGVTPRPRVGCLALGTAGLSRCVSGFLAR